jgi:hypothetical protein
LTLARKELVRTGFKPKEPKPAPGPKTKTCKVCGQKFVPRTALQVACGWECAQIHGKKVTAAQKAKAQRQERAQDKSKLDAMKTYTQLIAECQKAFNAVVRYRDMIAGHRCISSGRVLDWSGNKVDCGHFRSTGSAPHLRFNFDNAHAQDKHDNLWKSGNAVDYRIGLINRIGLERVEALEADNTPAKWTHDDLRSMTKEFRTMLREMKKGNANGN